jgi:hypothetical protein
MPCCFVLLLTVFQSIRTNLDYSVLLLSQRSAIGGVT